MFPSFCWRSFQFSVGRAFKFLIEKFSSLLLEVFYIKSVNTVVSRFSSSFHIFPSFQHHSNLEKHINVMDIDLIMSFVINLSDGLHPVTRSPLIEHLQLDIFSHSVSSCSHFTLISTTIRMMTTKMTSLAPHQEIICYDSAKKETSPLAVAATHRHT